MSIVYTIYICGGGGQHSQHSTAQHSTLNHRRWWVGGKKVRLSYSIKQHPPILDLQAPDRAENQASGIPVLIALANATPQDPQASIANSADTYNLPEINSIPTLYIVHDSTVS